MIKNENIYLNMNTCLLHNNLGRFLPCTMLWTNHKTAPSFPSICLHRLMSREFSYFHIFFFFSIVMLFFLPTLSLFTSPCCSCFTFSRRSTFLNFRILFSHKSIAEPARHQLKNIHMYICTFSFYELTR